MMNEHNLNVLYNENHLADLFDALDELHSAVTEGQLPKVTSLNKRELLAWLRDIIYTAQETIEEIDQQRELWREPMLRIVEKVQPAARSVT
jgi:hypothetical protein